MAHGAWHMVQVTLLHKKVADSQTIVAVEKLDLRKNGMILGDGKWSIIPYESLIGHPDATLFWTSSRI